MTDNEIIKALENIINEKVGCCAEDCAFYNGKVHSCEQTIAKYSLDLINRQKEEIERLRDSRDRWKQIALIYDEVIKKKEMVGDAE
jgi:biotin synthase-like enzyme